MLIDAIQMLVRVTCSSPVERCVVMSERVLLHLFFTTTQLGTRRERTLLERSNFERRRAAGTIAGQHWTRSIRRMCV